MAQVCFSLFRDLLKEVELSRYRLGGASGNGFVLLVSSTNSHSFVPAESAVLGIVDKSGLPHNGPYPY